MKLSSLLNPALVRCGLEAAGKDQALAEMARLLVAAEPSLTEAELLQALADREKLGPFSMGKGIAFPHARTEKVRDFTIVLATCPKGVDFKAPDGHRVKILILFAIPKRHSNLYLHTLAAFLNFFSSESNLAKVLEAKTPAELVAAIDQLSPKPREGGPAVVAASVPTVTAQTPVSKALELLASSRLEALPVIDADGALVGEFPATAVLQLGIREHMMSLAAPGVLGSGFSVERSLRQHADSPLGSVAGLVATTGLRTVQEDEPLLEVAVQLAHGGSGRAWVLRGTRLAGVVTAGEVLRRLGAPRPPQEAAR